MSRVIANTGILITMIFILGFIVLFIVNPQTYEELNNISLTGYNIVGMNFRLWVAIVIYSLVGFLNILFTLLLFLQTIHKLISLIGKILILLCGIMWLSLGVFPYDPNTEFGNDLLIIRLVLIILTSSIGLLFIGSEFDLILKNKFTKWYTVLCGALILILSFMSVFIFNDSTWIRTNLSFVIYFTWFGVIGVETLRTLKSEKWRVKITRL